MTELRITPDQLTAAGSWVARHWGEDGYVFERIESPTPAVSVFHVVASDGSRFAVVADKWGNCRDTDTTSGEERIPPLVKEVSRHAGEE